MTKKQPVKKSTVAAKKEVVKQQQKKVFYAVCNRNADSVEEDELWIYPTLEEAYESHIEDYDAKEPAFAYKIELIGSVSMQLNIKP